MTKRRYEIDIMKGILTVTMILCHCIQFFGLENQGVEKVLRDVINLATFSGFLFCFGYVGNISYYQKNYKTAAKKMLINIMRLLIAFYISGVAYVALVEKKIFKWRYLTEILLLKKYPGWSEFLASFAAIIVAGLIFFPLLKRLNTRIMMISIVIGGIACFLPYEKIHNPWLALFVGSNDYITYPVLQYGIFFLAGIWICKKEIKWNLWIFLLTIGASAPYWISYVWSGEIQNRFPPSIGFIGGGMVVVYLYYLLSLSLSGFLKKDGVLGKTVRYLANTGRYSLYYLLLSNIIIFAVDGSNFSYRSTGYASLFYILLLFTITYLNKLHFIAKLDIEEDNT